MQTIANLSKNIVSAIPAAPAPVRVTVAQSWPLRSVASTLSLEQSAGVTLPAHSLMQRAGLSVARLVCALAPHARTVWLACGPGNNGGDGLEAAMHLQHWGYNPVVTWLGDAAHCPNDALASLQRARQAGVRFATEPPAQMDVAVDALLGIGNASTASHIAPQSAARPLPDAMHACLLHMHAHAATIVCVDLPSGLHADTGCYTDTEFATQLIAAQANYKRSAALFCLSLLSLKPGLFTAQGRDAAGQIWFDDLQVASSPEPDAWLTGQSDTTPAKRLHASHKGSYGDVAVIGGTAGMTGAALLAARAALHSGAGRVFVSLLDACMAVDSSQPELMFRATDALDLRTSTIVCGCGGGQAVQSVLPRVLSDTQRLVLDADALNAISEDASLHQLLLHRHGRGYTTVLTPHPLEAARLLGTNTHAVQSQRLHAAQQLADRYHCSVVLKGSGSIIATAGHIPSVNPTGSGQLATAGTGDVLAGMVGAALARLPDHRGSVHRAVCRAVFQHGLAADHWPPGHSLTAGALLNHL